MLSTIVSKVNHMSATSIIASFLITTWGLPLPGMAAESLAAAGSGKPVQPLMPKLRAALAAEMGGIKQSMSELAPALAMGNGRGRPHRRSASATVTS
jgi:hypothetical protein